MNTRYYKFCGEYHCCTNYGDFPREVLDYYENFFTPKEPVYWDEKHGGELVLTKWSEECQEVILDN